MRIESLVGLTLLVRVLFGGAIAAELQPCPRSLLPPNIEYFPHELERHVQRIYDRSPTFRAQCERIGAADNLRLSIRIDTSIPYRHYRAFTVVERRRGRIRAAVHLPPSSDHSELLAHEFEHVIEQIEGLDLRTLARVRGSGVREVQYELFESDRAQAAGRVVVGEAGRFRRPPAAD